MNKKHVKEKISYEFDIKSFERNQAYQITLPTIGLERSTYIGILTYVDLSFLNGDISILKLGVVENEQ